ncbi:MAG TPA: UDP-N-acetylmuramate:L-alanyl-gamma-D-glutamyl-meso-diaminopimelate ligase, partial [Steroidobacteraceae bacterium]|nr:UDP-N-acetylmuramate:L-alanyl-gamma-D-glutamyl-meso-diaminopimelate ligase [Steroidobacteraceae bacterium]
FLIGGVPGNFEVSARLGNAPFFVIEADEYDTAFFDKRAKFVHYQPRTLILNNLEFDHADIYPDLESIQRQFSHLLRIVPGSGLIVHNAADANLDNVIARGCWTPREGFGGTSTAARWSARLTGADHRRFEVLLDGVAQGIVEWSMLGAHNVDNALAAIAAARHAGVPVARAIEALASFRGVKRRMELAGTAAGISVYDDFAHHPTAIATTIDGLRRRIGKSRLVAVLEARSNTMRMGVHRETLAPSLRGADAVYLYAPSDLGWDASAVARELGPTAAAEPTLDALLQRLGADLRAGDHVLIMSNGGFGGLHGKLLAALRARPG